MKARYRWQILLLAWLSPATLFQRLSELDWYGGLLRDWAESAIEQPEQRLLDVGCATGYLAGYLQQQGHRVSAVDAANTMIRHARKRYPAVDFQQANALQLPFDETEFDQVFCASLLNVVDEPADLIAELQRVTCTGGRLHFLFPQTDFSEKEFQALIHRMQLCGFSRAALESWQHMAPKKPVEQMVALLQAAGLEIEQQTSMFEGMLISITARKKSHE